MWEGVEVGLPEDKPAEAKKHVVVVGAGPGGLEAARVAAVRGHKVTVLDKSDRVAGLLGMAQVLNAKIEPLVSYWNEEMKLHPNIELKLNTYVDVDTVKALNPDEVIVSPGGGIISLDVPGIDGKNVVTSRRCARARCPRARACCGRRPWRPSRRRAAPSASCAWA